MTDEVKDAAVTSHSTGSGQAVSIKLIGYDRPFFSALAIAISIMSAFYSFEAGRQATQDTYWKERAETFLEILATQGYKVPPELLQHKEK